MINIPASSFTLPNGFLQPIMDTLESLYIEAALLRGACQGGQLVFPLLRLLRIYKDPRSAFGKLLGVFPNLETVYINIESDESLQSLVNFFRSEGFPCLVKWITCVHRNSEKPLADALKGYTAGIMELDVTLRRVSSTIITSIKKHGKTLKSLRIFRDYDSATNLSFMVNILGSREQLKSLEYVDRSRKGEISPLLVKENWKNPGSLQHLSLSIETLSLYEIPICRFPRPLPQGVTMGMMAQEPFCGWKVQGSALTQNTTFLQTIFELAEDFEQLRTITLNGIEYKKCH